MDSGQSHSLSRCALLASGLTALLLALTLLPAAQPQQLQWAFLLAEVKQTSSQLSAETRNLARGLSTDSSTLNRKLGNQQQLITQLSVQQRHNQIVDASLLQKTAGKMHDTVREFKTNLSMYRHARNAVIRELDLLQDRDLYSAELTTRARSLSELIDKSDFAAGARQWTAISDKAVQLNDSARSQGKRVALDPLMLQIKNLRATLAQIVQQQEVAATQQRFIHSESERLFQHLKIYSERAEHKRQLATGGLIAISLFIVLLAFIRLAR